MSLFRRSLLSSCVSSLRWFYQCESLLEFVSDCEYRPIAIWQRKLEALRDQWSDRLDNNSLISPTVSERDLLERLSKYRQTFQRVRGSKATPYESAILERLRVRAIESRRSALVSRLVWAFKEADEDGFYPVFVTLTVAPSDYLEVFRKGSVCWKNYVRRVTRAVGESGGLSRDVADKADIHRYFAVVEHGGQTGRLHIHVVHFVKWLPLGMRDPNGGRAVPDRRELSRWRGFWPHGFVTALPVRVGGGDVYARRGWRWPVVEVGRGDFVAYRSAGHVGTARYIGKYLSKQGYERSDRWRTRISRNLGLMRLSAQMKERPLRELVGIATRALPQVRRHGRIVPTMVLRRLAIREIVRRRGPKVCRPWSRVRPACTIVQMMRQSRMLTATMCATVAFRFDWSWLEEVGSVSSVGGSVRMLQ